MKRFGSLIMIALLLAGTLSLAALPPASAQGNSAVAKACQKGGWATLAREESPTIAFQNQDECVRYGAHGGVPAELVVLTPSITVTMFPMGIILIACGANISATGFAPNTTYPYTLHQRNGFLEHQIGSGDITADGDGAIAFSGPGYSSGPGVALQVVIGGFSSDFTPYVC